MSVTGVEIREVDRIEDLRRLAAVFGEIWGRNDGELSSDILRALSHSGNYVAAAFDGGRMVGGLVGWLGGVPPYDLHVHSHILGVLPGSETRGLGFDLKQHQRRWCLARDIRVMEWTTDPLIRRNVYFNLTKLGARAPHYLVDFYGEMSDGINKGDESDRLLIRWHLDSREAEEAAAGRARELNADALLATGAKVVLAADRAGRPSPAAGPLSAANGASVLLCQAPRDAVALRRDDPFAARSWRRALRAALTEAMGSGYQLTGATRSGWYVLESGSQ